MTPERFQEIRRLFLEIEQLPTERQVARLEELGSLDPTLQHEVLSLLAQTSDGDPSILDVGGALRQFDLTANPPNPADPTSSTSPATIGPYEVLGVLGRGGMGEVFHALQREPIRREVAIKRIPRGAQSEQELLRFQLERQTLAQMEHPGIAQVFDAGTDASGRPYFVMELVRGAPITEYASRHGLSQRARIALFQTVCHAVQHAHQKGVLHRDLKPSNILVTAHNGETLTKVIDFGIAKPFGPAPGSDLTQEGQLLGTIEYMSPEQLAGRAADVDTRSDVYALGVVLHELLLDSLPHDLRGKAPLEMCKVITEQPWSRTAEGSGNARALDGDLEVILSKALSPDRERRYSSPADLAQDLGRWMEGAPILARNPSAAYLVRKLVARNRLPVALGALLFLLVTISAITTASMVRSQRLARGRAEREAAKARAVSDFLGDLLGSVQSQGREVTVREVLDAAARTVGVELGEHPLEEAAVRRTLGSAYTAAGAFEEAREQLDRSLALRRLATGESSAEVAEATLDLASFEQARNPDSLGFARCDSLARLSYELYRRAFGPNDRHAIAALGRVGLARSMRDDGVGDSIIAAAVALARTTLPPADPLLAELLLQRTEGLIARTELVQAVPVAREALAAFRAALPGDHPKIARALFCLSEATRDPAEADSLNEACLAMQSRLWGEESVNLCDPLESTGFRRIERLDFAGGVELLQRSLAIRERNFPPNDVQIANGCNGLGMAYLVAGRPREAIDLLRRSLEIWEATRGSDHWVTHVARTNLARALTESGRLDESMELLAHGLAMAEAVDPRHGNAGLYHRKFAEAYLVGHRWQEAEEHARIGKAIFRDSPSGPKNEAACRLALAKSLAGQARSEEALREYAGADSLLAETMFWSTWVEGRLAWCQCLVEVGRTDQALTRLAEADARLAAMPVVAPIVRVDVLLRLAELDAALRRFDDARGALRAAVVLLPDRDPRQERAAEIARRLSREG